MAVRISNSTGNFTTAGTWSLVDSTSFNAASSGGNILTTVYSDTRSSAFTPGGIEIDGVAVFLNTRTGTTGTMSVELWNDTLSAAVSGTEVTINTADLPATTTAENGGWIFLKFSAPVTLLVANNYKLEAKTSSSSQVTLCTTGATDNLARCLRTTTTGAPSAGDDLIVCGERTGAGTGNNFTVTMDSTAATDYGTASTSVYSPALIISKGGTLTYGATAATNYILRLSGHLSVCSEGALNIGTVATPMPRDSSAVLEFDCAADGDFGLRVLAGATFVGQGLSRTAAKLIIDCLLNTDEAAAQTVLGVDTDTGWLDGDEIAIAPTSRTYTEAEKRTLSGAAGASSITVTSGLTNAHSGTSPTQAEVILLTRNVRIRSVSATAMSHIHFQTTSSVDMDWVEMYYLGQNATDQKGVDISTTTGSCNIQYCSVHDVEDAGVYISGAASNNITFSNNTLYNLNNQDTGTLAGIHVSAITSGSSITFSGNTIILVYGALGGIVSLDVGITCTDNVVAGADATGIQFGQVGAATVGTFTDNVVHSCGGVGILFPSNSILTGTFSNLTVWRNSNFGISFSASHTDITFPTGLLFGNTTANISLSQGSNLVFKDYLMAGDSTFATTIGVQLGTAGGTFIFETCDFGTATGIYVAHSTADFSYSGGAPNAYRAIICRNCKLSSTTEFTSQTQLSNTSFFSSQKHDQTAGSHKTLFRYGTIETDASVFNTAAPSEKLTPNNASNKLESGIKKVAVANSGTITANVYVRKSAAYNGNAPRLCVKRNVAAGISADTVLDTHTAAADTWEQLTGTTAAVTDDAVLEFTVDCDGTAGVVYDDDWTFS